MARPDGFGPSQDWRLICGWIFLDATPLPRALAKMARDLPDFQTIDRLPDFEAAGQTRACSKRQVSSMSRLRQLAVRLVLAGLMSATVAALAVPTVMGWAATYTCEATYWICVSENDNNTTPR